MKCLCIYMYVFIYVHVFCPVTTSFYNIFFDDAMYWPYPVFFLIARM